MTEWPEPVERVASVLRSAGVHGRIEELPEGVDVPPGQAVRAHAVECDATMLVAVVPADRELAPERLGCRFVRPLRPPSFPYVGARVLLERSLLVNRIVWLEAGSPRHFLGISPAQLVRLTRGETADLLDED